MKGFSKDDHHGQGGPRNKTLFILVAFILVSAWTLLTSIDLTDFNLRRKPNDNNFSGTLPPSSHPQLQPPFQPPFQPVNNNNNNNSNNNNDPNNSPASTPTPTPLELATSYLDPNTKYLSFMPFGGITNQFISVQVAAYIALKLNRTLLLPPIISNSHDHQNTHQRWSQYMDLPKLSALTGLNVLEWEKVRPLTEAQRQVGLDQALTQVHLTGPYHSETDEWAKIAENVTCQIIGGFGVPDQDINFSAQNFMFHFLLRPVYVDPLPPKAGAPVYDVGNANGNLNIVEDLLDRYNDFDDRLPEEIARGKPNMLFLSHTFKVKTAKGRGLYWKAIGQHMHFEPKLMEYATLRINEEIQADRNIEVLPNNDPEEVETTDEEHQNPVSEDGTTITDIQAPATRVPHIAVHLRRGDIWQKCRGKAVEGCVLPMERYIKAVERAREYASKSLGLLSHLPVVVTTDTTAEEDFQKLKELGWHRLDHAKFGTAEIWGTFGPAMVDAAILAHADVLVGSSVSTMSRIAGMRQHEWYGHESFFPRYNTAKMRRRRVMTKRRLESEWERDDLGGEVLLVV